MLVLVIEILEMLVLVIKFRVCIYEITIHHLKNVTLLLRHIVFVVDVLLQRTHVRDWAPPGWHWEVLPSGAHRLVSKTGPIVDLVLL